MSDTIGTYTFLPWLRQGLANEIAARDLDPAVKLRASVAVELELSGKRVDGGADLVEPISKSVALYGPGDIVGIDSKAIVKTEPRNWVTNLEPNYLPYVDFYDEDFPWRYTPAAPDAASKRLRPWIMLVVLTEDEFVDGKNIAGKPLPYIDVPDAAVLPPAEQLWAWAHVHVNEDLVQRADDVESTDMASVVPRLEGVLGRDPDLAYSRILCPRRLAENTAYHAFLVPVFETGRLAGLGLKPEDAPAEVHATASAWATYGARPEATSYPYYHRWYFRTSTVGDFEYLVRLLQPRPVDARVGRRDLDVQDPGSNIRGIDDAALGGILKLGGALKVPFAALQPEEQADVVKYDEWATPYPHRFQRDLAAFLNLADDYARSSAPEANLESSLGDAIEQDPDPLITPPLYGRWHALTERLLVARDGGAADASDNWVHELNLDPRWRVAAGFGTKIVQANQEDYMDAAWGQIGAVLEANRRIRLARMAKAVAHVWHAKHLAPLAAQSAGKALALTAPVQRRILVDGQTAFHRVRTSRVPRAAMSAPMRRVMRPRSRLIERLPFSSAVAPAMLLERIDRGDVTPVPPKTVPETLPTVEDVAEALLPRDVPAPLVRLLPRFPWLVHAPLVLILLIVLLVLAAGVSGFGAVVAGAMITGALFAYRSLLRWARAIRDARSVLPENQTEAAALDLPASPDFRVTAPGSGFTPTLGGSRDSVEAERFKTALADGYRVAQRAAAAAAVPPRRSLDAERVVAATLRGVDPEVTIPRLVLGQVSIPERIVAQIGEKFQEAMAYPEIDLPMYKPLVELSTELFLPNIELIGQNTISLLETNQKFIEAYMVGLNHEFARELLWREYFTDQRGSYFRQFWDVSSYLNRAGLDDDALRERLKDIPPLHRWPKASKLGDHDHREANGDKEEELVLVIRGELLKKYPTAVIYAHRAKWQTKADGSIDNAQERVLDDAPPIEARVKTPLYEAKVDPDIYFFGFDLTAAAAQGGTGENPGDDPGWFFVIKERPGEPRFGLDIEQGAAINTWNDLAWDDVVAGDAGEHIRIDADTAPISLANPHGDPSLEEKYEQYDEDKALTWNKDMHAAQVAYILYQVPVLVAVHAAEMLPKP